MTEEERYKAQAKIMEQAIEECLALEAEPSVPIAWIFVVASRKSGDLDTTSHLYLAPEGQPQYASIGLLMSNLDTLRGITNGTEWRDG